MSIEKEIGRGRQTLETGESIANHTHNGIDSQRLDLRDVYKQLLGDGDVNGVFIGTIADEAGSLPPNPYIFEGQVIGLEAWAAGVTNWLLEIKRRQEALTELLVKNRFGATDENQIPPITYLNKLF